MNYKVAIKMIGPDKHDRDLKDRILGHVRNCRRCRQLVEKKDNERLAALQMAPSKHAVVTQTEQPELRAA